MLVPVHDDGSTPPLGHLNWHDLGSESAFLKRPSGALLALHRQAVLFRSPDRRALSAVAAHFGVPPSDLAMWNGLDPEARVQPGLVLRVFPPPGRDLSDTLLVDAARVAVVTADSEDRAAALRAAERAASASDGVRRKVRAGFRRHVVRPGETLLRIAHRYRTTAEALARLNHLPAGAGRRVRAGQTLRVPR